MASQGRAGELPRWVTAVLVVTGCLGSLAGVAESTALTMVAYLQAGDDYRNVDSTLFTLAGLCFLLLLTGVGGIVAGFQSHLRTSITLLILTAIGFAVVDVYVLIGYTPPRPSAWTQADEAYFLWFLVLTTLSWGGAAAALALSDPNPRKIRG